MSPEHARRQASRQTHAIAVREIETDCSGWLPATAASSGPQGEAVCGGRQRKRIGMTVAHGGLLHDLAAQDRSGSVGTKHRPLPSGGTAKHFAIDEHGEHLLRAFVKARTATGIRAMTQEVSGSHSRYRYPASTINPARIRAAIWQRARTARRWASSSAQIRWVSPLRAIRPSGQAPDGLSGCPRSVPVQNPVGWVSPFRIPAGGIEGHPISAGLRQESRR